MKNNVAIRKISNGFIVTYAQGEVAFEQFVPDMEQLLEFVKGILE